MENTIFKELDSGVNGGTSRESTRGSLLVLDTLLRQNDEKNFIFYWSVRRKTVALERTAPNFKAKQRSLLFISGVFAKPRHPLAETFSAKLDEYEIETKTKKDDNGRDIVLQKRSPVEEEIYEQHAVLSDRRNMSAQLQTFILFAFDDFDANYKNAAITAGYFDDKNIMNRLALNTNASCFCDAIFGILLHSNRKFLNLLESLSLLV